jgi:hypothetical protein
MRYIQVTQKKRFQVLEAEETPTREQIQSIVGRPGQIARIEILHHLFSHFDIVLIRELKGDLKSMPVMAQTAKGEKIFGDFLVLRNVPYSEGYRLGGLTHSQILIAQDELQICCHPNPNNNIEVLPAGAFDESNSSV